MFHAGLVWKYRTNRPLTTDERALQLRQAQRLHVDPIDQSSVIRLDSACMDVLDKYFMDRGWLSLIALLVTCIMAPLAYTVAGETVDGLASGGSRLDATLGTAFLCLIVLPVAACVVWMVTLDAFRLTHYPIRLDRRQRMLHAFRQDKSILSVPWDEVFFTLARENSRPGPDLWEIQGHVLESDGTTVRDTFAFCDVNDQDILRRHWEFLRRYMEDGPQDLVARVKMYAAVDQRKETWWEGFMRIAADEITMAPLAAIVFAPFTVLQASARWLAMRSCTIPRWPDHIEAACRVEPDDLHGSRRAA